jgi:hypothetical protein
MDLTSKDGLEWLNQNMFGDEIEIHLGKKKYENERNLAIFEMIQQGAQLSEGRFYSQLNQVINHN